MIAKPKVNLFVIGMPRSGTTAMCDMLSQHPRVFIPGMKEPKHFCTDFTSEISKYRTTKGFSSVQKYHYVETSEEYEYLYSSATSKHHYLLDGSTLYLASHEAHRNIHKYNPDAKIIILLRDDDSFLRSWHTHLCFKGYETQKDFDKALSLQETREDWKTIVNDILFLPSLLQYYRWTENWYHVWNYIKLFGLDQVRVINYDDFLENNQVQVEMLLDWLNLEPHKITYRKLNVRKERRKLGILWKIPFLRPLAERLSEKRL